MRQRPMQTAFLATSTAVMIGAGIGLLVPAAPAIAVVGDRVNVPPPRLEFEYATEHAPYEVKKPRYLPEGMYLLAVLNSPESPEAYSVDLNYISDDGRELHVWMSNNSELSAYGKDPSIDPEGEPVLIRDEPWNARHLTDRGWYSLSRKFTLPEGQVLTLSAAGNLDEDVMRQIAASID